MKIGVMSGGILIFDNEMRKCLQRTPVGRTAKDKQARPGAKDLVEKRREKKKTVVV